MARLQNPFSSSGKLTNIGGGRINALGTMTSSDKTSGTKTKASSRVSILSKTTTDNTKHTISRDQPMVTPAISSKFASLVHPEITRRTEPSILKFNPSLLATILEKTTTQLARGAIKQIEGVSVGILDESINTIKNRNINPNRLMSHLERRVRVGEVLNEMAKEWDDETREDFAGTFNMDRKKLDVMDTIVSLAILNDQDLEDELRVEHTSDTSEGSLLEDRRVIWQYPPPGTPLDPPYLVFVAVEYQDTTEAQEVIDSILGHMVTRNGFKVPGTVVSKIRPKLDIGRTVGLKPRS